MQGKGLNTDQKKEWAKYMFLHEGLTHKEIALKAGISEKAVTAWVNDNAWHAMRKSLLITKEELLRDLFTLLELMKNEAKAAVAAGDPKVQPNINGIYKLALAIRKLENETGIGAMIDTFKAFINYMLKQDFGLAKTINRYADQFIKERLKNV